MDDPHEIFPDLTEDTEVRKREIEAILQQKTDVKLDVKPMAVSDSAENKEPKVDAVEAKSSDLKVEAPVVAPEAEKQKDTESTKKSAKKHHSKHSKHKTKSTHKKG